MSDLHASDPAAPRRRLGLFGGSFDPPHLAHRALAELALRRLALDALHWLPAGQPWQKAGRRLAPAEDRLAMLRLLVADAPGHVIDERELLRSGPSYTIDTVESLQREQPAAELFLVIGQDQYGRLDTWHRWRELVGSVTLAVAAREGVRPEPPAALRAEPHRVRELDLPDMPVSSTTIRARAARGEPLATLTGEPVARYIAQHHLYTEGNEH